MLELHFTIFNPSIDIFLIVVSLYYVVFRFLKTLNINDSNKIFWIDFQLFVILGTLFYLNYHNLEINFFGLFKIDWFTYFMILSFITEFSFLTFYLDKKIFQKKIKNKQKKQTQIQLENKIQDYNFQKIQEKKEEIKKIKKEINELNALSEKEKTSNIKKSIASLKYKALNLENEIKELQDFDIK